MQVPVQTSKKAKRAESKKAVVEKVEAQEKDHTINLEETKDKLQYSTNKTRPALEKRETSKSEAKKLESQRPTSSQVLHLPETQTAEVELKIESVESVQKQSKPALIWTDLQIEQWEDTEAQQQEQLWQKQF